MSVPERNYLFDSPLGILEAIYLDDEIVELNITHKKVFRDPENDFEQKILNQFKEYFAGKRKQFTISVHPEGTQFQQKVWKILCSVKFGETMTYQELAGRVEKKSYARAVAQALGRNPIMILIPCHRIVATSGIGGYSGGIDIKKKLLHLEGVSYYG